MKIYKKIFIVFSLALFAIVIISFNKTNVKANSYDNKIICNATINDNFDTSTIQIVLNEEASRNNKEYSISDFAEINCTELVDVTKDVKNNFENGNDVLVNMDKFRRTLRIKINSSTKTEILNAIKILENRNDIYAVSPNYFLNLTKTVNDPNITSQWSINNIGLLNAWDITTGSSEVSVGVIDTGIDGTHVDLNNRVNRTLSKDFGGDSIIDPLVDIYGHGTHVAGIIGAAGNNGIGISGVCWNVSLISLKVINDETGEITNASLSDAICYAINQNIPILNMSLGNYYDDVGLSTALQMYGGVVVAAAGNEERNTDVYYHYPSSYNYDNIISVGASTSTNNIMTNSQGFGGSNYGKNTVDLFAPGHIIYSTIPGNAYTYYSGTSMAAPHVAGVAALLLSKYPNLPTWVIKKIIMNGVDKCSDSSGNPIFTNLCVSEGRLNAYNSLNGYMNVAKGSTSNVTSNLNNGKGLFEFYQQGSGFVKITMQAINGNGTIECPQGSISILNKNGEVMSKCEMNDFTDKATNKENQSSFIVFMPESGSYYIDVDCSEVDMSSFTLLVENTEHYSPTINLFDYAQTQEFTIPFLSNVQSNDYIKSIRFNQSAKYNLTFSTNGTARLVVLKTNVTNESDELVEYANQLVNGTTTISLNLAAGLYYIGYFDLSDESIADINLTRKITHTDNRSLVTDPDKATPSGSQISVAERDTIWYDRSYRGTSIIEGFTRLIYLDDDYAPSVSRLDYDWYSSDENVAIVTSYGTVLAKNVSQNTTVKIMAVYKNDMSKVYVKEFTILNDTKTYNSDPLDIEMTLNVSAGKYTSISFGNTPVPINLLQYYYWSSSDYSCASVDNWGRIYCYYSAVGQTVEITGTYLYNSRVRIKITVNIVN